MGVFPLVGHRVTVTLAFGYESPGGRVVLPAGWVLSEGLGPVPEPVESLFGGARGKGPQNGVLSRARGGWSFCSGLLGGGGRFLTIPLSDLLVEELKIDVVESREVEPVAPPEEPPLVLAFVLYGIRYEVEVPWGHRSNPDVVVSCIRKVVGANKHFGIGGMGRYSVIEVGAGEGSARIYMDTVITAASSQRRRV